MRESLILSPTIFSPSTLSLTRAQDKSKPSSRATDKKEHANLGESTKRDAACGKCPHCDGFMDKVRAMNQDMQKKVTTFCALAYCKLQENYQRFKALLKSRMPSVKVC